MRFTPSASLALRSLEENILANLRQVAEVFSGMNRVWVLVVDEHAMEMRARTANKNHGEADEDGSLYSTHSRLFVVTKPS